MPVVASPIAMLTLPPIVAQVTVPETFWSCPSIVTFDSPGAAVALAVSVASTVVVVSSTVVVSDDD